MQYSDDRTSASANFAVLRLRYVAHSSLVEISSIRGNRHQSSVQLLRAGNPKECNYEQNIEQEC